MSVVFFFILLYGGLFGRVYYVLYVQTDEGVSPETARHRQRTRSQYLELLSRFLKYSLPPPKQARLDAQRLKRIWLNKERIREWPLATDEELAVYKVDELQARLDHRNVHCDQIIGLLCELDDPANRSPARQKGIHQAIQRLRMAPLNDLQEQSDARVREIISRHD